MLLTSPPTLQFKSLSLSIPFLHGFAPATRLLKPAATPPPPSSAAALPVVRAMKTMQGKVVCAACDKTVAVEVVRLVAHPKYKRRVKKKKRYQAHDPVNQFKVGDMVLLEKGRPVSKTKTFWAVPAPVRTRPKPVEAELGIPLQSES